MLCGEGALQTKGTCWFYSILNGLLLSSDGQKILYDNMNKFYATLTVAEKAYFDDGLDAPCPMRDLIKTKRIYFYKFLDQYLCFRSGPRNISMRAGRSPNVLRGIRLEGNKARGHAGLKGGFPQEEIHNVLDHIGLRNQYSIVTPSAPVRFLRPNFIVWRDGPKTGFKLVPRWRPDSYDLVCCSITIANTLAASSEQHRSHAITGYICQGKGFLFDSNQRKSFPCSWWNTTDLLKGFAEVGKHYSFFRGRQINYWTYNYVIFGRKEYLRHISPTCRMRYKNKAVNLRSFNLADPRLGANLNDPEKYITLNPAQRIAVKRIWARTEHRADVTIGKNVYNSILANSTSRVNGITKLHMLAHASYVIDKRSAMYKKFIRQLYLKFPTGVVASPVVAGRTMSLTNAKAIMNVKKTKTARKQAYSTVWRQVSAANRKILMHYRNTGVWTGASSPASAPVVNSPLSGAKAAVNAMKTAVARKAYLRQRGLNMSGPNWQALGRYVAIKNAEARKARANKKAAAAY